jgi:hypothetical protein
VERGRSDGVLSPPSLEATPIHLLGLKVGPRGAHAMM